MRFKVELWKEAWAHYRFARSFLLAWILTAIPSQAQDQSSPGDAKLVLQSHSRIEESSIPTWSIDLGAGDAAPVVVGNRVYVNEWVLDEEGNDAVGIRCLSAATGETLWQLTTRECSYESQDVSDAYPVRPIARLCYSEGRIVSVSYGGILSCADAESGELLWQHDLVSEFDAIPMQYGFASTPWCDGEKVVVACGGKQSLLMAFRWVDGSVLWSTEKGEAAFGSIAELSMQDGKHFLAYIGRDEMVGVDSRNGSYLWRLDLPKPGLTNAVTPIAIDPGKFFAAGQGFDGSRIYQLESSSNGIEIHELQRSTKFKPFYCNCLVAGKPSQILTYHSGFLQAISSDSGKVVWKQRNWTDANSAMAGDLLIGARGDGFVSTAKIEDDGLSILSGTRIVNDRVWAPPVIVGAHAILRGRSSLISFDWTKLPAIQEMPPGTEVDAMNAMYGNRPEKIVELLNRAKSEPTAITLDDYRSIADDRSLRMSEGERRELIVALAANQSDLSFQIAEDWVQRDPDSIVAYDLIVEKLQVAGTELPSFLIERLVEVTVDVVVADPTGPDDGGREGEIYLTGNAAACGLWKADGVKLTRLDNGHYQTNLRVPKGRLEFKFTRGSWETAEVRVDGRERGNRRRRIVGPMTIQAAVSGWKG